MIPWRRKSVRTAAGAAASALRVVLGLILLLTTASARADAPPRSVFLADLTWTEVRERIQNGTTTILVPIGGTEQSGPHMALGKHNVRATALAEKIAIELGNALVAPVIAYVPEGSVNPPTAHMLFPGTITVPSDTFRKVIEYAARSFKHHGFRDIVFLGDHGGYQADERAVADRLNGEWAETSVRVHAVEEYYRAAQSDFAQMLRARGFTDAEIGTHAGLADTSLTLALAPQAVRTDQMRSAPDSKEGVQGDPRGATVALGQLGVDAITARTVDAIRAAIRREAAASGSASKRTTAKDR